MLLKLDIHSVVELITNSSTVIYTYSEACPAAVRDLIEEVAKTFGIDKTADDMFYMDVFCESGKYVDYLNDEEDDIPGFTEDIDADDFVGNLFGKILKGEINRPEWFNEAEEARGCSCMTPDTYLYIAPKDEKYESLAKAIKKLIYSTGHSAEYDG